MGQEKCSSEKQPSKSDPWSSFGDASHELPKRVMGPELFLDVPKKGTYLAGRAVPLCDWAADLSNSGSPSFRSALQKSLPHGRLLALLPSLFPLSRHESLSQGLFPLPGRLVIYTVPRVNPQNNPFFASGTFRQILTGDR